MNKFLKNAQNGKNQWWRYTLVIICVVVSIIISNVILNNLLPQIKPLFPDNQFGKDLGMLVLIFIVFGLALITFMLAFQKIHQRKAFSLINLGKKFNWFLYCQGFLVWGVLLFVSALITDYQGFDNFLEGFNLYNLLILAFASIISIGIQSFFEEIIVRGYWLQGMSLRIKNIIPLVIINGLIFGLLHLGYSLGSFISTWIFGVVFGLIVLKQNRIEFASGVHLANNVVLSLFFLDLGDALHQDFSWEINWIELSIELLFFMLLLLWTYSTTKAKKVIKSNVLQTT